MSAVSLLMTAAEVACASTLPLPVLLLPELILTMAREVGVAEAVTKAKVVFSPKAGIQICPIYGSESAWLAGQDAAPSQQHLPMQ